jgi:hypothetical protein
MAHENESWRYQRIQDELSSSATRVGASTIRRILKLRRHDASVDLRAQATTMLAVDFFHVSRCARSRSSRVLPTSGTDPFSRGSSAPHKPEAVHHNKTDDWT